MEDNNGNTSVIASRVKRINGFAVGDVVVHTAQKTGRRRGTISRFCKNKSNKVVFVLFDDASEEKSVWFSKLSREMEDNTVRTVRVNTGNESPLRVRRIPGSPVSAADSLTATSYLSDHTVPDVLTQKQVDTHNEKVLSSMFFVRTLIGNGIDATAYNLYLILDFFKHLHINR